MWDTLSVVADEERRTLEARVAAPPKKKRTRIVDLRQLGQRVREGRKAHELSQLELAGLLGAAQGWLSEVESGDHASMEVDTVRRLAETLGVSTDYLLGLTDNPTPPQQPRAKRHERKDTGG